MEIDGNNANYRTVASGNWYNPTTWENGNIPPYRQVAISSL